MTIVQEILVSIVVATLVVESGKITAALLWLLLP
jgi:hypothetical protein